MAINRAIPLFAFLEEIDSIVLSERQTYLHRLNFSTLRHKHKPCQRTEYKNRPRFHPLGPGAEGRGAETGPVREACAVLALGFACMNNAVTVTVPQRFFSPVFPVFYEH